MMPETTIAEAIAEWTFAPHAAGRFAAGPEARQLAVAAILDTLGCLYAGRGDATVQRVASTIPQGGSAALVTGGLADPSFAAMLNATSAHALDFDDNFTPGMSHASAVILPALLAVATQQTSGAALIDAYLVALQAQAFVGEGLGFGHYTAGWHGTSTVGSVATAAGVAWLIGADREGVARALSLGCSFASGIKGQFGTPAKPFHAGMAARNAVEAARLSAAGLAGHPRAFEGPQGLWEMFCGPGPSGFDAGQIRATERHVIETVGLAPKLHPCCGSTHYVIDALADLRRAQDIDSEEVASIAVHVGIANHRNLPYLYPEDEMQARFSMTYCLARALRQGQLLLADFTPEAVLAHRDDPLLGRISMTSYTPEEEAAGTKGVDLPHRLEITFRSGTVLGAERNFPTGTRREPFAPEAMRAKFLDCCGGAAWAGDLHDRLLGLDDWPDLSPIATLFAGSPDPR